LFVLIESRREVQRRGAVRRPGRCESRLGLEQLLQAARAADRGRVEDVQSRIRVEDRIDELRPALVERVQDW